MPLYTFSVEEDGQLCHQLDLDLPDLDEAKREAIRAAGGFLSDSGLGVWNGEHWMVRVSENGLDVLNVQCWASVLDQTASRAVGDLRRR